MKKKLKQVEIEPKNDKNYDENLHEIYKAVAQAWHSHFNNDKFATSEFDIRRRNFQSTFSRFKLETLNKAKEDENKGEWYFNESLWDSYEIVSVSKKLETELIMNYDSCDFEKIGESNKVFRKRRESKNSLRNLFNGMSSRRFNHVESSHHGKT